MMVALNACRALCQRRRSSSIDRAIVSSTSVIVAVSGIAEIVSFMPTENTTKSGANR